MDANHPNYISARSRFNDLFCKLAIDRHTHTHAERDRDKDIYLYKVITDRNILHNYTQLNYLFSICTFVKQVIKRNVKQMIEKFQNTKEIQTDWKCEYFICNTVTRTN